MEKINVFKLSASSLIERQRVALFLNRTEDAIDTGRLFIEIVLENNPSLQDFFEGNESRAMRYHHHYRKRWFVIAQALIMVAINQGYILPSLTNQFDLLQLKLLSDTRFRQILAFIDDREQLSPMAKLIMAIGLTQVKRRHLELPTDQLLMHTLNAIYTPGEYITLVMDTTLILEIFRNFPSYIDPIVNLTKEIYSLDLHPDYHLFRNLIGDFPGLGSAIIRSILLSPEGNQELDILVCLVEDLQELRLYKSHMDDPKIEAFLDNFCDSPPIERFKRVLRVIRGRNAN